MSKPTGTQPRIEEPVRPSLDAVCTAIEKAHPGREGLLTASLTRLLHRRLPHTYRIRVPDEQLPESLLHTLQFLDGKKPEDVRVEVRPGKDLGAITEPYTVVRVTVKDQPFLFDTVRETIRTGGWDIRQVFHPVLSIQRDENGEIVALADASERPQGYSRESLIHFETQALDEVGLEELSRRVESNVRDAIRVVRDFSSMGKRIDETCQQLRENAERSAERSEELLEAEQYLRWLQLDHFIFLGYRAYDLKPYEEIQGRFGVRIEEGSGLGLLSDENLSNYSKPVPLDEITEAIASRLKNPVCPLISKANALSTVHRHAQMDYIGIKKLDAKGEIIGERRFLGLFTSKAFAENALHIPVLRRKLTEVLGQLELIPDTHDYKESISIFARLPKSELFLMDADEIARMIRTILESPAEDRVRVTLRRDQLNRGLSVMVILPRERFTDAAARAIQKTIGESCGGRPMDTRVVLGDEPTVRLHYYFTLRDEKTHLDPASLELQIAEITRNWSDLIFERLERTEGSTRAAELTARWGDSFPIYYREIIPAERAVEDIATLEEVIRDPSPRVRVSGGPPHRGAGTTLIRIYRGGSRFLLSNIMPWLDNLSLQVINELSFGIESEDIPRCYVHSFRVQSKDGNFLTPATSEDLERMLVRALRGELENDRLNGLIIEADLTWREADLVRTYRNFMQQVRRSFSVPSIHDALLRNGKHVRAIVDYHHARFDPDACGGVGARERLASHLPERRNAILKSLDAIQDVTDYRILAGLLSLIDATLRTNYFQFLEDATRIAIKIDCEAVDQMPAPRPMYEIYVHDTRMEGVHLRSGPVARGGIRWSDRRDDFRTEVLGLMKTQRTKNAVIVPVGSKGGFITKRLFTEREQHWKEGVECYQTFISGLLDITDNVVDGAICHPDRCVFYDGEDPYLVVAADKGTATFSDIANEISLSKEFWLGDAFASGGSQGYDHKKEGITARGAWECVKRHFREMNVDIQTTPFTVIGVGDMSGDVFGNGMLLSKAIRLQAAFDHRDIFLDPDPDPARSWDERKRIFDLPRSTWQDYDPSLLSEGGGIFSRKLRRIPLSPQVREMLDVSETEMSADELIRAILKMPCDLLWNGGIGTYVKASSETDADASDEANDAVRIDARMLRAQVVGEGGNLGLTQRARIEFAGLGGRSNTDAIDNSAGVDLSDHEVNLKVLFAPVVRAGRMTEEERNDLLRSLTDEVCEMVLRDNYRQSLVLTLDRLRSLEDMLPFRILIDHLTASGLLDRAVEFLPTREELEAREARDEGLTRPELAVLLAYAKIDLYRELLESDVPDDPVLEELLMLYFPVRIREEFASDVTKHALRREIVATMLTNGIIDRVGMAWPTRMSRMYACSYPELARAFVVSEVLVEARFLADDLDALDMKVPAEGQHLGYRQITTGQERLIPSILRSLDEGFEINEVIERNRGHVLALREHASETPVEWQRRDSEEVHANLVSRKMPEDLTNRLCSLYHLSRTGEIANIARQAGADLLRAMEAYYRSGTAMDFATALRESKVGHEDAEDEHMARAILTETLRETYRETVIQILKRNPEGEIRTAVESWASDHSGDLEPIRQTLAAARSAGNITLGTLFILNDRFKQLTKARK